MPKAEHVDSKVLTKGKWLQLEEIRYKDETGKERTWEMCSRTTKPDPSDSSDPKPDCVAIFTVLKRKSKEDAFVFVRQYRPCLRRYTLEFPAGLIDRGETAEAAALRELKEETGYTGRVREVGPPVSLDGGLSDTTVSVVAADVDGNSADNVGAVKDAQEGEFTEVLVVPVSEAREKMVQMNKDGDVIDSRVYVYLSTYQC